MPEAKDSPISAVPWKSYVGTALECFIAFYVATFCLAMYFTHKGSAWVLLSIVMVLLYLVVIAGCIRILIKRLSIAALMIIIPIAPLLALTTVISLIPVLERLR